MSETKFGDRIVFHPDQQIMEVDFSNLTFDRSKPVHAFYDEVDGQLKKTKQKWFFLVNYLDCRIMSEAWIAFAHRGKLTNLGYSLGSVRFAASADTSETIVEKSREENFDPNLFPSREIAVAHLTEMRERIPKSEYKNTITKRPETAGRPIAKRIMFHSDEQVMEVDFSEFTFATSADVDAFYDAITAQIEKTDRKWYFIVNYGGTEILPDAWYRWAVRSKQLNVAHSLGTVRFNPDDSAKQQILKRAAAQDANPNLFESREAALSRIAELRENAQA